MQVYCDGHMVLDEVGDAGTFLTRFLGWFNPRFKNARGVLIHPCNSVHTIGMRKTIDVVFVDEDQVICRIDLAARPWRIRRCGAARFVLELPDGGAGRHGFFQGQRIEFKT